MAVSANYVAHVLRLMAQVAPVSYRRIFHGVGLYYQGVQFAIIVHDRLYFRVDDASRMLYQERGMSAFRPGTVSAQESSFYQLPNDVLENPAELLYWMRTAVEASENSYSIEQPTFQMPAPVLHLRAR